MDEDIGLGIDLRSIPFMVFQTISEVLQSWGLGYLKSYVDKKNHDPELLFDLEIGGILSIFWSFWKIFSNVFVVILLAWSFVAELSLRLWEGNHTTK